MDIYTAFSAWQQDLCPLAQPVMHSLEISADVLQSMRHTWLWVW